MTTNSQKQDLTILYITRYEIKRHINRQQIVTRCMYASDYTHTLSNYEYVHKTSYRQVYTPDWQSAIKDFAYKFKHTCAMYADDGCHAGDEVYNRKVE